jgi:hypothetical protein
VAEAVTAAWWAFREAAGNSEDWDITDATAEVPPHGATRRPNDSARWCDTPTVRLSMTTVKLMR